MSSIKDNTQSTKLVFHLQVIRSPTYEMMVFQLERVGMYVATLFNYDGNEPQTCSTQLPHAVQSGVLQMTDENQLLMKPTLQ